MSTSPGSSHSAIARSRREPQHWSSAQLTAVLFLEPSPASLKYALSLLGLMSPQVRLPLVELTDSTKADVAAVMDQVREDNADYLIGKMCESTRGEHRSVAGQSRGKVTFQPG
jgi:hypothetical protein